MHGSYVPTAPGGNVKAKVSACRRLAQVRPAGRIPRTGHDVPVDFIVTPERIIDCRAAHGPREPAGICWEDLTEEKIESIPLLLARRADMA